MMLPLARSLLRPFRPEDAPSLALHANNWNVWRNLRDTFPHPYRLDDARFFVTHVAPGNERTVIFAIEVDEQAVGAIGVERLEDVWSRSADVGFWLGEAYWGQGIVTEALSAVTELGFSIFDVCRIQGRVFGWNRASARVFEKVGYAQEAVLRCAIVKQGKITDEIVYARLREDRVRT